MRLRKLITPCLLGLFCLFNLGAGAAANDPSVTVSIKPVHSLVAGIMNGVGEPALIIKGNRSPHTYSMKPSDARTLSHSDIVIWVGPGLESFLEKPIAALSEKSQVITLIEDAKADPHLWLSPTNAASIIDRSLAGLIEIDPDHGEIYRKNARALKSRLKALKTGGSAKLDALREKPFLVFHDAWGHFAKAFGLSVIGSVALNPERPPGAKRISAIRRLIAKSGARCLFREPQFQSPLISTVLEGQDSIKEHELDPMGSALSAGPDLYFKLMENNIDAVASCLQ
jgi:zinc transport system substrate-binding protein